ncbi:hypothetical protein MOSE0_H06744 [Monosporozyma servazzii]
MNLIVVGTIITPIIIYIAFKLSLIDIILLIYMLIYLLITILAGISVVLLAVFLGGVYYRDNNLYNSHCCHCICGLCHTR